MSAVAAAISVAISHSSRRSSARRITKSPPPQRRGRECRPPAVLLVVVVASRSSVGLDVELLVEEIEHLLADAALGPLVGRLHRLLPGGALLVGQVVQGGLARLLDLLERVLVLLLRDRVGVVGRLVHRLLELLAYIGRQAVPELRVDDD